MWSVVSIIGDKEVKEVKGRCWRGYYLDVEYNKYNKILGGEKGSELRVK